MNGIKYTVEDKQDIPFYYCNYGTNLIGCIKTI